MWNCTVTMNDLGGTCLFVLLVAAAKYNTVHLVFVLAPLSALTNSWWYKEEKQIFVGSENTLRLSLHVRKCVKKSTKRF